MAIIKNTYDTVKQAFQDVIAPQLAEIKGELSAVRAEIRRIDNRLDNSEKRLDDKIDALRAELSLTRQHLDEALNVLGAAGLCRTTP